MEPASAGLRKIVGKVLRQCPPEEAAVLAWPAVCGKPVAERTTAVAFADGILTVAVPDAPWGAQLATFTPQYVAGFSELLGPVVREVRFKVAVNIAGSQR